MKLTQKKLSNVHSFTFGEMTFNYAYSDKSGSGDFDVPYIDFPTKSQTQIEQNEWLRNAGYIWCVIGVLDVLYAVSTRSNVSGLSFWLLLGMLCLAWFYLSKVRYSVFRAPSANVFVIQDGKSHDKIVKEIQSRKKEFLLGRYGEIDSTNDPDNEIEKFRWLCEQGVLDKHEADNKIAQIEFRRKNS